MTRRLALAVAVLALALLATGCGEKQERTGGDSEPIALALDFYVNPDHAGIYTALDRGYFADYLYDAGQLDSRPDASELSTNDLLPKARAGGG